MPIKFTRELKDRYLLLLRQGHGRYESARLVGISSGTVLRHVKADGVFRAATAAAELEAIEPIERKLYESARDGEPWAVKMVLERRDPDRWKDTSRATVQVQHSGTVAHVHLEGPPLSRIESLRQELEQRRHQLEAPDTELTALDIPESDTEEIFVDPEYGPYERVIPRAAPQ